MAVITRPGVYVGEAPLPRVVQNPNTAVSLGGFVGTALKGPTTPELVTSWSDFVSKFGGFGGTATLPLALYQFFANTSANAYVSRVLASDATSVATPYTPAPTRLTFRPISKGAWGNSLTVDVTMSADASTFTLAVRELYRGVSTIMEQFRDLSMVQTNARYVTNIVNSSTIGSQYIVATDLLKNNTSLPATGGATVLAGNGDGVAPITSGDYGAAFALFDDIPANFVFNAPGVPDVTGLVSQIANGRQDSIIVCDTAENQTVAQVSGSSLPSGPYAAVYYPWVWIADPAPDAVRGAIRKVPPGASVVGMIIRTDTARGVFKAPAGVSAALGGAVSSEARLTNTELDTLAAMNVNVIRPIPGSGIVAMGARTRTFGTVDQYISVRRTINYVKRRASDVSRFALFEPNTPSLWEQLRVVNGAFLSELWSAGGLAGLDFAQAYYVKCDGENNTAASIAAGEVHVDIGIAPAFPSEFVMIRVGVFESDASIITAEGV